MRTWLNRGASGGLAGARSQDRHPFQTNCLKHEIPDSPLRTAANEATEDDALPIGYRGIQRGVQEASTIRVTEITEDYPWVRSIMEPLRGNLTVPCLFNEMEAIWRREKTLEVLESALTLQGRAAKLPPQHLEQGMAGIAIDLENLGMLNRLDGKRIQMPDVYRVAFGLGRRGGVKPLK